METAPERLAPPVRDACEADLTVVCAIYAHYVATSPATFEETAPDHDEIVRRWRAIRDLDLPYLVAEIDGRASLDTALGSITGSAAPGLVESGDAGRRRHPHRHRGDRGIPGGPHCRPSPHRDRLSGTGR